jgi:hypothetical protein
MELAVKLQIKPPAQISLDEVLKKNSLVDDFIARSRWKSHMVQDSSIPSDADLGDISTQWWTRFQAATPAAKSPQVVGPHKSGSKRPGGIKRASQTDGEESRDGENGDAGSSSKRPGGNKRASQTDAEESRDGESGDTGSVSGETTPETSSQKASAKEMPARREKAKETSQKTMFFNPVSVVFRFLSISSENTTEMFLVHGERTHLHGKHHRLRQI